MPQFSSNDEFKSKVADIGFWWPQVESILRRHGLEYGTPVVAPRSSYPTILTGDVVVKLYGYSGRWRQAHTAELAAYRVLSRDRHVPAPRLIAAGELDSSWSYLVISQLHGETWQSAAPAEPVTAAADLGRQVGRMHALRPDAVARYAEWPRLDVAAACAGTQLPQHLLPAVNDYVAGLPPSDEVFSNGDLFEGNILTHDNRITGLIDWGDALVIDRHSELAKIHLSVFGGDKSVLRAFLNAASWPVAADFARRALGWALTRQAVGIAQHGAGFDNFYLVPKLAPDVADLNELAEALFAV